MKIGMIGLGRMGANMVERLRRSGHQAVGFDRDAERADVSSLEELVKVLEPPRFVWSMVPAGRPTQDTIRELGALLERGDMVVDGANSNFRESVLNGQMLAAGEIGFCDAGVSGGVWGLEHGYALMVGGRAEHVELLKPVFEALAPENGFAHVGGIGAGHFVKMVHNAVEYGLMQAYAEGYELLRSSEMDVDVLASVRVWRHGSVVRSWLLDLLVRALEEDPDLEKIGGYVEDSGEGRWSVQEAIDLAVPVPVIAAALFARFASRQESSPAMRAVAALRNQFGGHAVRKP